MRLHARLLPSLVIGLALCAGGGDVRAGQPTAGGGAQAKERTWIRHKVLPGERLQAIADRYGVHRKALIRWNKLDADGPRLRAGQSLKVRAEVLPPAREEIEYVVKSGDTWRKIASDHGVSESELRRWNFKVPRRFMAGTKLRVWIEPEPADPISDSGPVPALERLSDGEAATAEAAEPSPEQLPVKTISSRATSVGKPTRGRISRSVQLPENEALYKRLRPDHAYGSSHSVSLLQTAIARWRRDSGYTRGLSIGALSKEGGGKLSPHKSHQSGRDVDIRLPLAKGVDRGTKPERISDVDWDATWALVKALLDTEEVVYIFLEHGRQKSLYRAARRAGASKEWLAKVLQYPGAKGSGRAIIRHAKGHTSHFHVRFTCGEKETRCETH
jgi:LysM repeat protein